MDVIYGLNPLFCPAMGRLMFDDDFSVILMPYRVTNSNYYYLRFSKLREKCRTGSIISSKFYTVNRVTEVFSRYLMNNLSFNEFRALVVLTSRTMSKFETSASDLKFL